MAAIESATVKKMPEGQEELEKAFDVEEMVRITEQITDGW